MNSVVVNLIARRPAVGQILTLRVSEKRVRVIYQNRQGREEQIKLQVGDKLYMNTEGFETDLPVRYLELVELFGNQTGGDMALIDSCWLKFHENKSIGWRSLAEFKGCSFQVTELA